MFLQFPGLILALKSGTGAMESTVKERENTQLLYLLAFIFSSSPNGFKVHVYYLNQGTLPMNFEADTKLEDIRNTVLEF